VTVYTGEFYQNLSTLHFGKGQTKRRDNLYEEPDAFFEFRSVFYSNDESNLGLPCEATAIAIIHFTHEITERP
jgi:hypothetical protein